MREIQQFILDICQESMYDPFGYLQSLATLRIWFAPQKVFDPGTAGVGPIIRFFIISIADENNRFDLFRPFTRRQVQNAHRQPIESSATSEENVGHCAW